MSSSSLALNEFFFQHSSTFFSSNHYHYYNNQDQRQQEDLHFVQDRAVRPCARLCNYIHTMTTKNDKKIYAKNYMSLSSQNGHNEYNNENDHDQFHILISVPLDRIHQKMEDRWRSDDCCHSPSRHAKSYSKTIGLICPQRSPDPPKFRKEHCHRHKSKYYDDNMPAVQSNNTLSEPGPRISPPAA